MLPIRRIFCIGKNYADHVKEMGGDPSTSSPVFFTKPADAAIFPTTAHPGVIYPLRTEELHYEAELVLQIKSGGANISQRTALSHIGALGLGCDLTRRDLQARCKAAASPWDIAKAFDQSAVLGEFVPATDLSPDQDIRLSVNGVQRQASTAAHMIYSPAQIIAELSTYFELKAGDLIFTGTPDGVGAIVPGDDVVIEGNGLPALSFRLEARDE